MNRHIPTTKSKNAAEQQLSLFPAHNLMPEAEQFVTEQLITYIGNKRRLLPLIESALVKARDLLGRDLISFADVFAGTGVVARMARRFSHTLYINDFEPYSAFSNAVYHRNYSEIDIGAINAARLEVNEIASSKAVVGFITELYSPEDEARIKKQDRVFYTRRNAMFIDTARREIDRFPQALRPFILAPLIQRSSVHVNTSGVFKGFYKNGKGVGQFGGNLRNALQRICAPIEIPLAVFSRFERRVRISQLEASEFVGRLPPIDVAYFDPPYNQHPYGSNYFMLNLILKYERPTEISRVSGIPRDWQRSDYNVRARAMRALHSVLERCPARILLVSYNSEGFISVDDMIEMLTSLGVVTVYDQEYNTFRGCRNLSARSAHVTEFLFKVARQD
jgi:adenine-specific DNA-methyltransferase